MIGDANKGRLSVPAGAGDQATTAATGERAYQQARAAAIYYLSLKKSSSGQVSRYLVRKGWPAPVADVVSQALVKDGYINDIVLAQQVLKGRCGRKAESFAHLEQGFPPAVRAQALDAYRLEGQSDLKLLAALLKSKYAAELRLLRDKQLPPERCRELHLLLLSRAAGRGFTPALLRQLLNLWGLTLE